MESWIATLPEFLPEQGKTRIRSLMEWLVDPGLRYVRREVKEIAPTEDSNLVQSLMVIFLSLIKDYVGESSMQENDILKCIDALFIFSLVIRLIKWNYRHLLRLLFFFLVFRMYIISLLLAYEGRVFDRAGVVNRMYWATCSKAEIRHVLEISSARRSARGLFACGRRPGKAHRVDRPKVS